MIAYVVLMAVLTMARSRPSAKPSEKPSRKASAKVSTRKSAPKKKASVRAVPKGKVSPEKKTNNKTLSKPLNLSARSLWPKASELVGLDFALSPPTNCELYAQYTIGLHAWFLQQIQAFDPALSAYLHDGQSEKAFSLSGLNGQFMSHSQSLQLRAGETYHWRLNALSKQVAQGLAEWLRQLPEAIEIKNAPLKIEAVRLAGATTYAKVLRAGRAESGPVSLSFVSPTSFRRKGQHLPLPWPRNVFHSYLRRWNHFVSPQKQVDATEFLDWIDNTVVIRQHQMASMKVAAGKQGSVTGFTGAITYGLNRQAAADSGFQALFYALVQLAPYCGTGHKTTFGLGETQLGWRGSEAPPEVPIKQQVLAERIDELTALFLALKKRKGGSRATDTAQKWATILARREQGDGLDAIATDMDLPYETAKTYSKLARRALKASNSLASNL